MVILQDDALARLGPVGARGVRKAHPREKEAEGDQKDYQDLRAEMAGVATDHGLS